MSILDELEDYKPGQDPTPIIWKTTENSQILREDDDFSIFDSSDKNELFDELSQEDDEGIFLRFDLYDKYNNISIYQNNNRHDYILLVNNNDDNKIILNSYELGFVFYENLIIIHGWETMHIIDTDKFKITYERTR